MSDSKLGLSTIYAILVVFAYVLIFNILKMFVTDIRKEFYEVVANQVTMSSLRLRVFSITLMEYLVTVYSSKSK